MKWKPSPALILALGFASSLLPPLSSAQQQPSVQTSAQQQPSPQQPPTPSPQQDDSYEDEVVRITTNLVQVDAVVTDANGEQVTNLSAEDFEIIEDGKPQPVTNFSYVSTQTPAPRPSQTLAAAPSKVPTPPPAPMRREQVRRTIALVVDDIGLSFESTAFVRQALKKFVDEQLQPGDMAAVIRTSAGIGALQQFTTDKALLYAAIERVRWYPMGRGRIGVFSAIERNPLSGLPSDAGGRSAATVGGLNETEAQQREQQEQFREELFSVGTLGALNFVVRGLRELPGRKSVVLFSDGVRLFTRAPRRDARGDASSNGDQATSGNARIRGDEPDIKQNNRVLEALQRLTDLANRASVVIYTIDARGAQSFALQAADNAADLSPAALASRLNDRRNEFYESQEGLTYVARLTGGFSVNNSNDLSKGLGRVLEDQKGYYLIGYRPGETTFDPARGRSQFHQITVRVKRPGLSVRTRLGFYGVPEESARASRRTPEEQIAAALSSPFTSGQVGLRLTALFNDDPRTGSVIRSVLHIDARNLLFKQNADGSRQTVIDLVAFTYGDDGQIVKQLTQRETISESDETYRAMLDNGIFYTLDVPVRKAGVYQLRIAVRDASSEHVGAANQLVEVPDLKSKRLAQSGIVVSGRYLKGARGASPAAAPPAGAEEEADPDPQAVPALRRFRQGMMLSYIYVVYNAQPDKATGRPQLQTQARLFRDGEPVFTGKLLPLDAEGQTDMARLYAGGRIYLGANLPPGNYVLQTIVNDALAPQSRRTTTQWIDFEILKSSDK